MLTAQQIPKRGCLDEKDGAEQIYLQFSPQLLGKGVVVLSRCSSDASSEKHPHNAILQEIQVLGCGRKSDFLTVLGMLGFSSWFEIGTQIWYRIWPPLAR